MKTEPPQHLVAAASREKREILDQLCNDQELIERLRITPQELDSLGRCALLGTLTCKQDLLFILRQIREATGGSGTAPTVFGSAPTAAYEDRFQEPTRPDINRIRVRLAVPAEPISQPSSFAGIVHRRFSEQFGITFWSLVVAGGVVLNLAIAISHWRANALSKIGMAEYAAPATSHPWYTKLDDFHILILAEILFVICVAVVVLVRSRSKHPRRFKIRPV